ncbi:MAG TPA: hemerythrin domain-containing protein [Acidimicrobiales bacterium]|nr:hemerythrin domain-containing protein [Acidimicrobiales bacterium]
MADITKVLVDDHLRAKRLLTNYEQSPWRLDLALEVCDELKMHSIIEEEIFYPAVRDAVDGRLADESQDEHAQVEEIIAAIEDMDPGDPDLERTMRMLRAALTRHMDREENVMFPKANVELANELLDMGREAFARRQELMNARAGGEVAPSLSMGTANVGWRTRGIKSATANLGW